MKLECASSRVGLNWLESKGTLRYSPKLLGDRASDKWWLVVDCDPEIGKYYRHLFGSYNYHVRKLSKPAWKEHITVVRDEEPKNKHFWENWDQCEIIFYYRHVPRTNGVYWWLDVKCEFLHVLRTELGLLRNPSIPFHLSFGHEK